MKRQKGANNVNQSTRQRHEDMKKIKTDVLSLCFPSILTNKGATSNGMSALAPNLYKVLVCSFVPLS